MRTASVAAGGSRSVRPAARRHHRDRAAEGPWPVHLPVPTPASHCELLGMALVIQRAAAADDRATFEGELRRFRTALVEHARAERDDHEHLAGPTRQLVRDGQLRLKALVDDLLAGTASSAADGNGLVRAAELRTALGRQARLESRLLAGPAARIRRPARRPRGRP
jgi:hypothetical protein